MYERDEYFSRSINTENLNVETLLSGTFICQFTQPKLRQNQNKNITNVKKSEFRKNVRKQKNSEFR